MKYRNASERLPAHLVRELQLHAPGELLYIPAVRRRPWGEGSGAKLLYARRNAEIREKHLLGQNVDSLSEAYCISDETVRKIIYQKGGIAMTDPISSYYWEDELVRLRRSRPEDWALNRKDGREDSQDQFFTDCYQALPVDSGNWPQIWESYVKANEAGDQGMFMKEITRFLISSVDCKPI